MAELEPDTGWRCWCGVLADSVALTELGAEHAAEVDQDEKRGYRRSVR